MKRFILTFVLVILCSCCVNADTNWKRVATNNYVDMDGIVGLEDIYGFSFLMKSYNKGQYEPVNGREILYTLNQYELDCGRKKYKIGIVDSYDDNEIFVNGDYNKYATFQPIVSGTAVYEISKQLCR